MSALIPKQIAYDLGLTEGTELSDKTGISTTPPSQKISVERTKITLSELSSIAKALGTTGADIMAKAEDHTEVSVA